MIKTKFKSLIVALTIVMITNSYGQTDNVCAVKIGKNYYINCKKIISFQNQPVLTITNSQDNSIKINFDVFSTSGTKVATVKEGKLAEGNKDLYIIKLTEKEFSFIEKSTNRIICFVKKTYDQQNKRCELQVSADMYMPSGFYFQCTPETTNVPFLNNMQGATFANSDSAISLN